MSEANEGLMAAHIKTSQGFLKQLSWAQCDRTGKLPGSDDYLSHLLHLMREAKSFQDTSALQKFYILQHDSANLPNRKN